ncbi:branched-chain amino acid ABC transporter permease [Variovorax sp. M-6]|uniref:branched-chain amino acid ABC transporter permease n=1 Tax=Variovorax sp. M-6 TaxID=3233041 RepID=UPI003F96E2AE
MNAISPYLLHIGIMTGIFVLLVQSLNIMLGYSGLLSLATPALFGMGAYASALLTMRLGWDSTLTFTCATAIGALSGLALGVPSLRLSRHSFVIVTLSATLLLQLVASNWIDLTRGSLGIADIPTARLFGVALASKEAWLAFMVVLSALAIAATWSIVSSRLGRAMVAVRDNEPLAVAAGIDVLTMRLFAFACSGAFAGLAGACYAHYLSFIDPGIFGFSISESLLVMVILGGSGTLWGPVAGAVIFTALPEVLRMAPELKSLLYGVLLLLIVLFMPQGMARWFGRPAATGAGAGK